MSVGLDEELRQTFIVCECQTEGVEVNYWRGEHESVYLSMWEAKHYGGRKMLLKQRFRSMWRIMRHGEPYKDEVSLSHDEAGRLADALVGK